MQNKPKKNLYKIIFLVIALSLIITLTGCDWLSGGIWNIFDPQAIIKVDYTLVDLTEGAGSISLEIHSLNGVGFNASGFSYEYYYYTGSTKVPIFSKVVEANFYVEPSTSPGTPGPITTIDNLPLYFQDIIDWLALNPLVTEVICDLNLIGKDTSNHSQTIQVASNLPILQPGIDLYPPTAVIITTPAAENGNLTGVTPFSIIFNASESYDNEDGDASVRITSYNWDFGDETVGTGIIIEHTYDSSGIYIVTLTVSDHYGNQGYKTIIITVTDPEILITIMANPESNVPGGTSTITSIVTDEDTGEFVPDGTTVYFHTNSGTLSADSANTTNGIATVILTLDDNMKDGETATVNAFIGSINTTTDPAIVTCIDIIITISADPLSISPGIPSTITAIVTDKVGNPEVDKIIIFFTTNGTFSSNYCSTDASGIATSELTFASDNVGDSAIITAKCGSRVSNEIIITCIPPVEDDIVYRALLIGVGDYENDDGVDLTDLDGPPYDVDRIMQVLDKCKFGSDEVEFSLIDLLKDLNATKEVIINRIASTFSDADNDDISYFYFSGHGYLDTGTNISYLCPTDTTLVVDISTMISVDELEIALSAIPGTKVVILDTCHSGGFIGKGKSEMIISKEELTSFNDEIINVFSQSQSRDQLTTNQYKVLTSCHYYQTCLEWSPHPIDGNPYGYFTYALCKGCGYNTFIYPYPADENENSKVSLQEAYLYVESTLELFEQDVQVYPADSTFTIVEY